MKTERPHKKLLVWQKAIELAKCCYEVSNSLPEIEKFGLSSQLKRASVSVSLNIAEGAARNYIKEYVRFLYISSGSLSEVDTINELMRELNYIDNNQYENLKNNIDSVSALLAGLIKSKSASIAQSLNSSTS